MKLFDSLNNRLHNAYYEYKDFRTTRHIVVFESDDWGSIRMPKKNDWNELLQMGYAVDKRPYERFDILESAEDIEALFDVLCRHKDCHGNHPIITANMLMANPDFERIEKADYQQYFYEPIANTYTRYYGNAKVLELMKQGMDMGVFMPQCHGREHFNVAQWMNGLQRGDEDFLIAFRYGICGIAPKVNPEKGNQLMNALQAHSCSEQEQIDKILVEGLQLFEQMWGFKSLSFVAPCYCWNRKTEQTLSQNCVKLIQTSRSNKPTFNDKRHFFYSGQLSSDGLKYSIRNCTFEPATIKGSGELDTLMRQVDSAFDRNKIAVFSTHRINYVSGLSEFNRLHSLTLFDQFLNTLVKKYSDVEFFSSDRLMSLFI